MHELVETLFSFHGYTKNQANEIITRWLTKKAEELHKHERNVEFSLPLINSILGLEVKEESSGKCCDNSDKFEIHNCLKRPGGTVEKEKWCSHYFEHEAHAIPMLRHNGGEICAGGDSNPARFLFCPFCGKERPASPKKKTLAEVLQNCFIREDRPKQQAKVAANEAIEWFTEVLDRVLAYPSTPFFNSQDFSNEVKKIINNK